MPLFNEKLYLVRILLMSFDCALADRDAAIVSTAADTARLDSFVYVSYVVLLILEGIPSARPFGCVERSLILISIMHNILYKHAVTPKAHGWRCSSPRTPPLWERCSRR